MWQKGATETKYKENKQTQKVQNELWNVFFLCFFYFKLIWTKRKPQNRQTFCCVKLLLLTITKTSKLIRCINLQKKNTHQKLY